MQTLYGDGIHDDTQAIQQRIDSGTRELCLPMPSAFYLISRPLVLPSDFHLVLPRNAEVRLAPKSDCVMLINKTRPLHADRLPAGMENIFRHILAYIDEFDPDFPQRNIAVTGGVWNCNNLLQSPNPMKTGDFSKRAFSGFGMLFYNVDSLRLSDLTIKNPTNYGAVLDKVTHFSVQNITFDYNKGNPLPITMDGIHLCGNCRGGVIRNLRGACYDDMVAVNADDGSHGEISDIEIDGLYAENCHSAVRLLSVHHKVRRVRVRHVEGTFFQYCVGVTKYFPGTCDAGFEDITLENIRASKAPRTDDVYPYPDCEIYPLIWVEPGVRVETLTVRNLHRDERTLATPTLTVGAGAHVQTLTFQNITVRNRTSSEIPLLQADGTVEMLIT